MPIVSFDQFVKQAGGKPTDVKTVAPQATAPAEQPGYLSRVGAELKASYQGLQKTTERGAELMGQDKPMSGAVMSGLGAPAAFIRGAMSPITAALSPLIESGLKATGITDNQKVQDTLKGLDEWSKANPDAAENLKNIFEIASTVGVGKIATALEPALESGIKTGVDITAGAIKTGVGTSKRATAKIIKAVEPKPLAPTKAVGQVLQGEVGDIPAGVKGLSTLDTTGVKTYSELGIKIKGRIGELAKKVDEDLGVDKTKRALKDLIISGKTTSGKVVKMKPIDDALSQLDELYTKTGDKLSSANIKELALKAKNEGLTDLEVNNIARVYGSEFGDKAFSKIGEPLTSVNAQMYENTRTSLKEIARRGIKGAEAKTADKQMTALYKTQTLIQKNVEAVNKLQQRIQERGLLEKVGHSVSKYGDLLTGGSLRGFVGGLLPRGAGYKVLTALDLEKALEKNLEIIQKAIKSGNDDELLKIIKSMEAQSKNTAIPKIASQTTTKPTAKAGATAQSIKNKSNGTISKILPQKAGESNLLSEARKYKTAEEFVKAQGTPVYHGSSRSFKNFDVTKLGEATKSRSAKEGFFFTDDLGTAKSYATAENWKKVQDFIDAGDMKSATKLENQIFAKQDPSNVVNAYVKFKKPLIIDADGATYGDFSTKIESAIDKAKKSGNDGLIIKRLSDNADYSEYTPATHYLVLDNSLIKTRAQLTSIWEKANKK